jgi:hypothetical protein
VLLEYEIALKLKEKWGGDRDDYFIPVLLDRNDPENNAVLHRFRDFDPTLYCATIAPSMSMWGKRYSSCGTASYCFDGANDVHCDYKVGSIKFSNGEEPPRKWSMTNLEFDAEKRMARGDLVVPGGTSWRGSVMRKVEFIFSEKMEMVGKAHFWDFDGKGECN